MDNEIWDAMADGSKILLDKLSGLNPMIVLFIGVFVLLIGITVLTYSLNVKQQAQRRQEVMNHVPVSAQRFLEEWRVGKRGSNLGYKALDQTGCYVILTNPARKANGDAEWDAVYVGQSVHVCSRVRQHLTGHGNGDVYADVRAGEYVEVRIVPCDRSRMNDMERDLIEAFNATNSYNRTRGGARVR